MGASLSRAWLFPRAVADHSRSFLWYTRLRLTWCLNLVCGLPVSLVCWEKLRIQESGLASSWSPRQFHSLPGHARNANFLAPRQRRSFEGGQETGRLY